MASYVKFYQFVEDLGVKVHNLDTDTIKVYLTNNTPNQTMETKSQLAGITEQNGYTETDISSTYSQTTGTASFSGSDITFTATGAGFGPFRYVVIFNDSATAVTDPLIAYWDYGTSTSISAGETFTVDFSSPIFTLS